MSNIIESREPQVQVLFLEFAYKQKPYNLYLRLNADIDTKFHVRMQAGEFLLYDITHKMLLVYRVVANSCVVFIKEISI